MRGRRARRGFAYPLIVFPSSINPDHAWFDAARFGLFVHWGAYSVATRGEWVSNRERIPHEEYRRLYAENSRAERHDPAAWAGLAKEAGAATWC